MRKLRNYQQEAIDKLSESFPTKKKHLLVMPTGSGKTFTILSFLNKQKKKTLFLAHTQEILLQTKNTYADFKGLDLTIMSIQKASMNLEKIKKGNFEIIIIDECHRSAAKTYLKIIEICGSDIHLIGMTATPYRFDNQSIYNIFGTPCFHISILQLIKEGFLCDIVGYRIKTNVSLQGISTRAGDFINSRLAPVINTKNRNELIVSTYKQKCEGEKVVGFCASIKHAHALKLCFVSQNIPCEVISGQLTSKLRENLLKRFSRGEIKVVLNVQVLTEGFDEPSITSLLMCRPTKSPTLYMQMIGRGTRLFPGKEKLKVIEFTDNGFDLCDLNSILESRNPNVKYEDGESLLSIAKKSEELLVGSEKTIISSINPIPALFKNRLATPWQIRQLRLKNIDFQEPITETIANYLLAKETNGIN